MPLKDWLYGLLPRSIFALALLAGGPALQGQEVPAPEPPVASSSANPSSEVPDVPGLSGLLRGINAGLTLSGIHDAQTGWATVAQPAIGYTFSDHFAADITVPIYMYRLAESASANPRPGQLLVNQRGEPGDVVFALHAEAPIGNFVYEATVSATAPTGDAHYALTSGRATFDLSNRFERSFRLLTPNVELGVGDSTTLINPLVKRNFTSLGPLAHFELGVSLPLPFGASFSTNAYEQLPIGDQKIYQSITRKKGPPTTVVSGRSVTEDNGFTNAFEVPLSGHVTLSTYYSRSLRLRDDVVSFGVTYVLRSERAREREASDDMVTLP